MYLFFACEAIWSDIECDNFLYTMGMRGGMHLKESNWKILPPCQPGGGVDVIVVVSAGMKWNVGQHIIFESLFIDLD